MLELETRFEVKGNKVLIIGWFEGRGTGRLVVTGPNNVKEEVQVPLEVSLLDEVQVALSEAPGPARVTPVRVHFTAVTDRGRLTRAVELGNTASHIDTLSFKLLNMAEMLVRGDQLKKIVATLIANRR